MQAATLDVLARAAGRPGHIFNLGHGVMPDTDPDVLGRLRRAPVLHVMVVDGVALGWGTEFLLTADWRIACDGAVFGLPETGLGIVPGAGGTSELWTEIGVGHVARRWGVGQGVAL